MLNTLKLINHNKLDRLGAAVSLTCALHCTLTPLLVGLLPLAGLGFLLNEQIEWAFIIASIGLGVISLMTSYLRQHKQSRPLLLFGIGMSVMLAARLGLGEETRLELAAVLIGALLIVCAHLLNQRLCRICLVCNDVHSIRKENHKDTKSTKR